MNNKNKSKVEYGFGEPIIIKNGYVRVARSRHKIKLPDRKNNNLAYLTGYHLGDGFLTDIRKVKGKYYEITYGDSDKEQIDKINKIFINEFNHDFKVYKKAKSNIWIARTNCKALHWYLHSELKIPYGQKSSICIPKWVLEETEFISNFISGFYDAEGDIGITLNRTYKEKRYYKIRIQLTQKCTDILLEIKKHMIDKFKIKSGIHKKWNQEAFILKIDARNAVNIFENKIGFRNPSKREKLQILQKKNSI